MDPDCWFHKEGHIYTGNNMCFYHCSQQLYNLVRKLKHIKVRIFHTPFPPNHFPWPRKFMIIKINIAKLPNIGLHALHFPKTKFSLGPTMGKNSWFSRPQWWVILRWSRFIYFTLIIFFTDASCDRCVLYHMQSQ